MEHVPALAAGDRPGPRRSLILAGGGMRVAYQAGVLRALEEEGLSFVHADGTSGGTINLAMLLSSLTPAEMCQRWRTLKVRDFASLLPLRKYFRATKLMGFGDADGLVGKVYPHLGVDVARIRAARGIEGTFNICNFGEKTNVAVPHTEVDLDVLVAGVTLPIFMPPVERNGALYVDSVWIKDANPTEAVRRGCEELWLVWCIGNTRAYRPGAFNQYVHMIELSANGSLFEELAQLRTQAPAARLHVIKPEFPLPLDPDFYFGRVDADALVSMGYRDAKAYLQRMPEEGVEWAPTATQMREQPLGVAFARRLNGGIRGTPVQARVRADVRDLDRFRTERAGELVGILADGRIAKRGTFRLERRRQVYELVIEETGGETRVVFSGSLRDAARFVRTLHATGSDSLRRRLGAVLRFAWLLVRG